MAELKYNSLYRGTSGKFDQTVFRQRKNGKTVIAKLPRKHDIPEATKAQMERFKAAVAYSKNALADNDLNQHYKEMAKKFPNISPYNLAMRDYLRPPVIQSIQTNDYKGKIGDKITIEATDDFQVKTLSIAITSASSSPIESGNATLEGGKWLYTTTVANTTLSGTKIKITATDVPGNQTSKEVIL